jgi:hypothetical protein
MIKHTLNEHAAKVEREKEFKFIIHIVILEFFQKIQ